LKPFPLAVSFVLLSLALPACLAQNRLLVDQKGDRRLAIVDPAREAVIASVPENGNTGHEVAASADGKLAFVPIYGNSAWASREPMAATLWSSISPRRSCRQHPV